MAAGATLIDVLLELVKQLPAILSALASVVSVIFVVRNLKATKEVHAVVNSEHAKLQQKLDVALNDIAELTGKRAVTAQDAPTDNSHTSTARI